MKFRNSFIACLIALCASTANSEAFVTIHQGKIRDASSIPTMPLESHYANGVAAFNHGDWDQASRHLYIVTYNAPDTSYGKESFYFLGVSYYNLGELDYANEAFTQYLKLNKNPQFYEDTVAYKLDIANQFKSGAKKHLMGWQFMPKWTPADDLASEICDEINTLMPCHEVSAQALFMKGEYLWQYREYRKAVETYRELIQRFPKHELCRQSYVAISKVYLEQGQHEINNADVLGFAEVNMMRFKQQYPDDPLLAGIESDFQQIQECYASSLYEIGLFYERTKRPSAAVIYYSNATKRFPTTQVARYCQERLNVLNANVEAISAETMNNECDGSS